MRKRSSGDARRPTPEGGVHHFPLDAGRGGEHLPVGGIDDLGDDQIRRVEVHALPGFAFAPVDAAEVGAAEHLARGGAPQRLQLVADRGQSAARLAADADAADAQFGGGHTDDVRRLFGEVGEEVGRADERLRTLVGLYAQQTLGTGLRADRDVDDAHVPGDLDHREPAHEAFAHAESVQHAVARPEAVGVQGPGAEFAPDRDVRFGEADVRRAAGGARRRLDLDDLRHRRRHVRAERRMLRQTVPELLLLGEGEIGQVVERRHSVDVHRVLGEFRPVELAVGGEVRELLGQPRLLHRPRLVGADHLDGAPVVGGERSGAHAVSAPLQRDPGRCDPAGAPGLLLCPGPLGYLSIIYYATDDGRDPDDDPG
ncbi:hypothetical protein [Gordonia sihwensis]|uniref:hypothetical protein n=1 Tax=Gordonia TaxID=2053 RepID=UPI0021B43D4F|nr:hypothetical protein [Gordonia sihwensis]WFN92736.1 hypothetical protein P5P27_18600 [Gordonia sihwensis]